MGYASMLRQRFSLSVRVHAASLFACAAVACALGCSSGKDITIAVRPDDASILIDNLDRGRGPLTAHFSFDEGEVHKVTATRFGFKEETVTIDRNFEKETLLLYLKPRTRKVTVNVAPVSAVISVDGKPLSLDRVSQITTELEFHVDPKQPDPKRAWIPHVVSAEAPGYRKTDLAVSWTDQDVNYTINLESMRKDVQIVTEPKGAEIFIDDVKFGISPLTYNNFEVKVDPRTGAWAPRKVRAIKRGYEPAETVISGDQPNSVYELKLPVKLKAVRIMTDPPDAVVKVGEFELKRDESGAAATVLRFPPDDETGELPTYKAVASKRTDKAEWESRFFTIAWDNGKGDYQVKLTEVSTAPVRIVTDPGVATTAVGISASRGRSRRRGAALASA